MLFEYGVHIEPPPEGVVSMLRAKHEEEIAIIMEESLGDKDPEASTLEVDAKLFMARRRLHQKLAKETSIHGGLLPKAAYESIGIVFSHEIPLDSSALPGEVVEFLKHEKEAETGLTFKTLFLDSQAEEGVVIATRAICEFEEAYLLASWGKKRINLRAIGKKACKRKMKMIREHAFFALFLAALFAAAWTIGLIGKEDASWILRLTPVASLALFAWVVVKLKRSALQRAHQLEQA